VANDIHGLSYSWADSRCAWCRFFLKNPVVVTNNAQKAPIRKVIFFLGEVSREVAHGNPNNGFA
jgi:hypothetical protein